jgi:hypothetical protein
MQHEEIAALRARPGVALLRADNAPGRVFVEGDVRDISASQLITRLDDELFALNDRLGEGTYPKSAKSYLDDGTRRRRAGCASSIRRVPMSIEAAISRRAERARNARRGGGSACRHARSRTWGSS